MAWRAWRMTQHRPQRDDSATSIFGCRRGYACAPSGRRAGGGSIGRAYGEGLWQLVRAEICTSYRDSVPVKRPTDTGSLAGKVPSSPSSRRSSRCFCIFESDRRASIRNSASASAISSGSSPSSLPAAFSVCSHASFSDGVPCRCNISRSEILGNGRPSDAGRRCFRFPGDTWNIDQSRSFCCVGFFGSATTLDLVTRYRHKILMCQRARSSRGPLRPYTYLKIRPRAALFGLAFGLSRGLALAVLCPV